LKYFSIVTLVCLIGLGCITPSSEDVDEAGGAKSETPTVALRGVVAGLAGMGILLQNHSPEDLLDVDIVINERSNGGFRFHVDEIKSNTTHTYLTQVFRNAAGTSFNPQEVSADGFAVYADTPRGRGSWQGQYRQ